MPKTLLIYPEYPPSYWGMHYALEIFGIKAAFRLWGCSPLPPCFRPAYDVRVVDMNVTALKASDLAWADLVCTSSMIVQRESLQSVVEQCNRARVPVVAGGAYPTTYHQELKGVDHFVLDEVEETFGDFLRDFEEGTTSPCIARPASRTSPGRLFRALT